MVGPLTIGSEVGDIIGNVYVFSFFFSVKCSARFFSFLVRISQLVVNPIKLHGNKEASFNRDLLLEGAELKLNMAVRFASPVI